MVQIDHQVVPEKTNTEISTGWVVTTGMVTIFMAIFCGRGAVAATQCSKGATLTWPRSSCVSLRLGPSRALVLRADQETSLTTLLDEIKARKAETCVERTAVES